jgi:hypothetical protein
MAGKRRFGRVRRLPPGRWQARYKGPDGIDHPAPSTFATKADAERWLSLTEADIIKDNWRDPDASRVKFADYACAWVAERPNLRPKTLQLYQGLVRIHLVPGALHPGQPGRVGRPVTGHQHSGGCSASARLISTISASAPPCASSTSIAAHPS